MIPVDIKIKRFEECGHLCIAAASVSNILYYAVESLL